VTGSIARWGCVAGDGSGVDRFCGFARIRILKRQQRPHFTGQRERRKRSVFCKGLTRGRRSLVPYDVDRKREEKLLDASLVGPSKVEQIGIRMIPRRGIGMGGAPGAGSLPDERLGRPAARWVSAKPQAGDPPARGNRGAQVLASYTERAACARRTFPTTESYRKAGSSRSSRVQPM